MATKEQIAAAAAVIEDRDKMAASGAPGFIGESILDFAAEVLGAAERVGWAAGHVITGTPGEVVGAGADIVMGEPHWRREERMAREHAAHEAHERHERHEHEEHERREHEHGDKDSEDHSEHPEGGEDPDRKC